MLKEAEDIEQCQNIAKDILRAIVNGVVDIFIIYLKVYKNFYSFLINN